MLSGYLAEILGELRGRAPNRQPVDAARALGRPIRDLDDPFALHVHRVIEPTVSGVALPALPRYVRRRHDQALAAVVANARTARQLVVLVGGSSTGKSRALWEAIHQLPDDWRLWQPRRDHGTRNRRGRRAPGRRPAMAAHGDLAERTTRLPQPARNRLGGGRRDSHRRGNRDDPETSVLVVGTLWPEQWATLAAEPQKDGLDLHAQARQLLSGHVMRVEDDFCGRDQDPDLQKELEKAAEDDPRWREAESSRSATPSTRPNISPAATNSSAATRTQGPP